MARRKAERTRRAFGKVSVKGKRVYAEYTGPDGAFHRPGHSFPSKIDAEGWLAEESLAEGCYVHRVFGHGVRCLFGHGIHGGLGHF